jgi:hypothetical protein
MVLAVWAVRSVGLVAQVAVGAVIYPPLALVLGVASAEQVAGVRRLSGRLGQLIPARQSAR